METYALPNGVNWHDFEWQQNFQWYRAPCDLCDSWAFCYTAWKL